MLQVIGLVLPFFGLILVGYVLGKLVRRPVEALGWMTAFILYLALPALFFQLLSRTPIEELTQWRFVLGSLIATYCVFAAMFVLSMIVSRGDIPKSTMRGLAAAYGNIGYMGPGLALIAFGEAAAVPVALIFCFENLMHFTLAPLLMALAGTEKQSGGRLLLSVVSKVALHPFVIATVAGVIAAALHFAPPEPLARFIDYLARAAAPCALFAMGVTLALRPLRKLPLDVAPIATLKLAIHPVACYMVLSWVGDFPDAWMYTGVLLASLPTATNVFVIAQQYGVWVERASATILVTTLISVLTVTSLIYLFASGTLPPDLFPQG